MNMNDYPESIRKLVAEVVQRHKNDEDLEGTISDAVTSVKATSEYPELVERIIRDGIRQLVYAARHVINVSIRREAGHYGPPSKLTQEGMEAQARVYQSAFDYCIGSRTLGSLTREDLLTVSASEGAKAQGHLFNSRLTKELAARVKEGKTVKECMKERDLKTLFQRIEREVCAA